MDARITALLLICALLFAGCTTGPANSPSPSPAATASTTASDQVQTGVSAAASAEFKTYDGGVYRIGYPQDWTVNELDGIVVFQAPLSGSDDAAKENVNVLIVPTDQTLEAFVETALGPTVESAGFELLESSEYTLSGRPARQVIYSEPSDDARLQYMQTMMVNEGIAAVVTYTATPDGFAEFKDEADAMTASFEFKTEAAASVQANPVESSMAPQIVRKWRVYSQSIYYDAGGSNFLETPATTLLQINSDQTWSFGTSSGTWSVQAITDADWQKWGVGAYGPTRKLVLNGWNGETNDGPIEESGSRVDFMWVIYRVGPPTVQAPAQIQMKFGQTYSD